MKQVLIALFAALSFSAVAEVNKDSHVLTFTTEIPQICGIEVKQDSGKLGVNGNLNRVPATIVAFNNEDVHNQSDLYVSSYTHSDNLKDGFYRAGKEVEQATKFKFSGAILSRTEMTLAEFVQSRALTVNNGQELQIAAAVDLTHGEIVAGEAELKITVTQNCFQ